MHLLNVLGKMGSIGGIRVGSSIGEKSNGGRKNKDVVQGTTGEGSRFWKKMRIFLGCMLCSSKGEGSSRNKINQAHGNIYLFHHYFLQFTHLSLFN